MNELLISVIVVLIAVIIALAAAIIIKNRRLSALKRSIDFVDRPDLFQQHRPDAVPVDR